MKLGGRSRSPSPCPNRLSKRPGPQPAPLRGCPSPAAPPCPLPTAPAAAQRAPPPPSAPAATPPASGPRTHCATPGGQLFHGPNKPTPVYGQPSPTRSLEKPRHVQKMLKKSSDARCTLPFQGEPEAHTHPSTLETPRGSVTLGSHRVTPGRSDPWARPPPPAGPSGPRPQRWGPSCRPALRRALPGRGPRRRAP